MKVYKCIDGACANNPGGWGAYIMYNVYSEELYGGEGMRTNNRMEIKAAIESLNFIKDLVK